MSQCDLALYIESATVKAWAFPPKKHGISSASACNCTGNDLHRQTNDPPQHCYHRPEDARIFMKHNHTDRYKSRQRGEKCAYGAEQFCCINLSAGTAFRRIAIWSM